MVNAERGVQSAPIPSRQANATWFKAGLKPRAISRCVNLSRVQIRRHAERCVENKETKKEDQMLTVVEILEERCRREREILFACFDLAAKAKEVDLHVRWR